MINLGDLLFKSTAVCGLVGTHRLTDCCLQAAKLEGVLVEVSFLQNYLKDLLYSYKYKKYIMNIKTR
jgi:hypothetical protein